MTATTVPIETRTADERYMDFPMAEDTKIPKGVQVQLSSGYATGMTKAASLVFVGIAAETVDNSDGAAGAKSIRVWRKGLHELAMSGAAITSVGSAVYAADNCTVTTTSTDATKVGEAAKFENTGKIFVDIDRR